ncbi:MAG: S24/S26 family peptidase [Clostridia bacterium]|nr:S24/S26 family peptidase [Clostridia bacterium]
MEQRDINNVEDLLKHQSEAMAMTAGGSMRPLFRQHRDIVVIERVTRPLKKNDVPLYHKKGYHQLVLHRIIKITENGYVIRGDNLLDKETDITDQDIVGVLKAFYRKGKYVVCAESFWYQVYIRFVYLRFPFLYLWRRGLYPVLRPIYRFIFGKK